ncbi:predicted protein [Botrytis cinerea T4]|uniref:Uncharacterized protein n=1 Tax=Botryotinia fuckeliana (strain T4) TaxID=999810 RepID=G2XQS8_BOTF4|nr:predicted protein [Botrytis cinerea T4]
MSANFNFNPHSIGYLLQVYSISKISTYQQGQYFVCVYFTTLFEVRPIGTAE